MRLEASVIIAAVSVIFSGTLGLVSVWLALRKRTDEDSLARATRRTTALQLLSDEEFVLIRVRDECVSLQDMIAAGREKLGTHYEHFASEAARVVGESKELLQQVQAKRRQVEPQIQALSAAEIEGVIAVAYHGKKLAEAQLQRTLVSKSDALRSYGL